MTAQSNAPIIIKRVKKVVGGGHHGGAWKVAYADFVTAMMAFFLLMWLLNATTEKQRKGIADYFSPTIPVNRVSGGGDGSFGGDSIFTEEQLAQNGMGGMPREPSETGEGIADSGQAEDGEQAETEALQALEEMLTGRSGESMVSELAQRHIVTQVTDEGLVIELFDIMNEPLFSENTAVPTQIMVELSGMMARVFSLVENDVAVTGHVRAQPVVLTTNTVWELSAGRAETTRQLIGAGGLAPGRMHRVTGHADSKPAARNPMAIRNNRIELVLLRSDK